MSARQSARHEAIRSSDGSVSSCLGRIFFTFVIALTAVVMLGVGLNGGKFSSAFFQGECNVSHQYPREVLQWCALITTHAGRTGLPPDLVAALIWQESGGNPNAYSRDGAVGLMQVMPRDGLAASFTFKGQPCFLDRPTTRQLQDPEFNIRYGTQMLQELVEKYGGNYRKALREYGPIGAGYSYADIVLAIYRGRKSD